jgi:glycosyltransferase involved in cell wall biosynthesis
MSAQITMIGSAPGTRGGVAALVEVYAAHGLFQRSGAVYLATHRDGTRPEKLRVAIHAWADFISRLARGRVSLLHVHLASNASFWRKSFFIVPARARRIPYVLHMHGGDFLSFYRASRWPGRQAFIRWIYRGASHVIALSEEWREPLLSMEPESRLCVIPNPVEVPPWSAPLDEGPPTVLFLGVLAERKGVFDLLHAWQAVLARHPRAHLVLAGAGSDEQVRALARALGVQASLSLPGWVSAEERGRLLRETWAFALPSHIEALPMAVLEAMAAGVPVVATTVGGIPGAVEHGRTGYLVAPRDVPGIAASLCSLLDDAALRKAFGAVARERVIERFSAEVVVPRIEGIWAEALARG